MEENKSLDKKSLSFLKGRQTDWGELAKDCVAFANAQGGEILIGIEDFCTEPPKAQKIKDKKPSRKHTKKHCTPNGKCCSS